MKQRILSGILTALGLAVLVFTAVAAFSGRNQPTTLLSQPEAAQARTEIFMDALCQGDWALASESLYGTPDISAAPDSAFADALWQAYQTNLSYSFDGECYADGNGISRDVTVTYLDIPALLSQAEPGFRQKLAKNAAADPEHPERLDETGAYKESYVLEVLAESAQALLAKQPETQTASLTLHLVCRDGQWLVLPDSPLTALLSGEMGQ